MTDVSTKHARRTIADVETDLHTTKASLKDVRTEAMLAFYDLQSFDTVEDFRKYSEKKEREIALVQTIKTLEDEFKELIGDEDAVQKRARLEPSYQRIVEKYRPLQTIAEEKKAVYKAADEATARVHAEYRKLDVARTAAACAMRKARDDAKQILDENAEVVKAYNETFEVVARPGQPCPFCGKTFRFNERKCKGKCVFHRANDLGSYGIDALTLHKGTKEDCPVLFH